MDADCGAVVVVMVRRVAGWAGRPGAVRARCYFLAPGCYLCHFVAGCGDGGGDEWAIGLQRHIMSVGSFTSPWADLQGLFSSETCVKVLVRTTDEGAQVGNSMCVGRS